MADIQHYERVLKPTRATSKILPKALMISAYVALVGLWFVLTVRVGLTASVLMLIPISVLIAVTLTWKYTAVEYEYSFVAGTLTFSKIYGKSKRRAVFDGDLRCLVSVLPYNEQNAERVQCDKTVFAIPEGVEENPCICVFEENEKRTCVVLDCDELSAKIFRFFKPSAVDRAVFEAFKTQAD